MMPKDSGKVDYAPISTDAPVNPATLDAQTAPTTALGAQADKAGGTVKTGAMAAPAPAAPTTPAFNTGSQGVVLNSNGSLQTPATGGTPASTTFASPDGQTFGSQAELDAYMKLYNAQQSQYQLDSAAKQALGQSAYDTLYSEFNQYGLGALIEPLKGMIAGGATGAQLSLALQNTDAYKTRFSANADRIAKGLSALSPAQYVGMEDQYQNIMRQYGLPATYYTPDSTGKQPGFDQLLANDVSATELNDRISTAQQRVLNANPEVLQQLKIYYPDITNGDIMAYALDPKNAITDLKQKVTTAEIGGAAAAAGLSDTAAQASQLASYGITGAQAQQNYGTIAQMAQRGSQLASIYNTAPYGQDQATAEIFNTAGQTDAANQRKKLTALEQAQFSGQSGTASNAFSRERAMSPMMLGVPGAGAF